MAEDVNLPAGFVLDEEDGLPEGFVVENDRANELQALRGLGDREAFGEMMQQGIERKEPTPVGGDVADPLRPVVQGATFGFSDELAGAMGAIPTALATGQSIPEAYTNVRDFERAQLERIQQESPYLSMAGEIAGSIPTGLGALNMARGAAPQLAEKAAEYAGKNIATRLGTAAGLGAVSGGVYGAGTGGTEETPRLEGAVTGGALGSLGGLVGASAGVAAPKLGRGLAERAKRLFGKQEQAAPKGVRELQEIGGREAVDELPVQSSAYSKIEKAIRDDFGADADSVLQALKNNEISIADLAGQGTPQLKGLAKGAAQYPSGQAGAERYFNQRIADAPEVLRESIGKNISSDTAYYATADAIAEAGRNKAAPLYEKAYAAKISNTGVLTMPEVESALEKAYKTFPSELQNAAPDSIKALDYAKRVLDDDINKAMRAGEGNLSRSRTQVKNRLVAAMDEASPDYAKARKEAGDYLSLTRAMDEGKSFMKADPELLSKEFKKLSDQEKVAFRSGVAKALRDQIESGVETANSYNRIFGRERQQKRLQSILSPEQYKNLSQDMKATDRLFYLRNEVIGGAPTASKQVARGMIEAGGFATDVVSGGWTAAPRQAVLSGVKRMFDGLNDKTAKEVAAILYEDRPAEKLKIINNLSGKRYLNDAEREQVKRAFFEAEEALKTLRTEGAVTGGAAANIMKEE